MDAKLTLSINRDIARKAKVYAKNRGRSLSDVIESYLKMVANEEQVNANNMTPLVKSLKGSFKAPENFDYKTELTKELSSKYLR